VRHSRSPVVPTRLSPRHEFWVYASGTALLISGAGWLLAHYALAGGPAAAGLPAPSEPWWLRVHGAALILFLVVFGALVPNHLAMGWRQRRNRSSGVVMLTVVAVLTLSGYGLYYSGDEPQRALISVLHWAIGLAAALALAAHALLGKRGARR
jgi:hypothetical protein